MSAEREIPENIRQFLAGRTAIKVNNNFDLLRRLDTEISKYTKPRNFAINAKNALEARLPGEYLCVSWWPWFTANSGCFNWGRESYYVSKNYTVVNIENFFVEPEIKQPEPEIVYEEWLQLIL